jgi:hypothetical protein
LNQYKTPRLVIEARGGDIMNITQTQLVNEALSLVSSSPVNHTTHGANVGLVGMGSDIETKIASGQAARDFFQETTHLHREHMNRPSVEVDPELKARVLEKKKAYLEKLIAEKAWASSILSTQQTIELIEADKLSNESLQALLDFMF